MIRPMLAATIDPNHIDVRFPLIASPKLDGIRCLIIDALALTRSLKAIPNDFIRKGMQHKVFNGMDGELICGSPTDKLTFNRTTGAVRSVMGEPDFTFYVFDDISAADADYSLRLGLLEGRVAKIKSSRVVVHEHKRIETLKQLLAYEEKVLDQGYEGLILRSPHSPYKYGRSTLNEAALMKLKRFTDSEAKIIGFDEQMHNTNQAKTNELGRTARSKVKSGLVGKGTLGALVVRDIHTGAEFRIGTGMDDQLRQEIWDNKKAWRNVIIKYKYFSIGTIEAPRHPVYLGLRPKWDR